MTKRVGWVILRNVLLAALALFVFLTALFFFLQAQRVDLSTFYGPYPSTRSPPHYAGPGQRVNLFTFWKNSITSNLGSSFSLYPRSVWEIIKERLPRSLFLFTLALLTAIPLGKGLERLFRSRWGDNGNRFIALGVYAVFLPWLASLLLWIFAFKLGLLPIGKFVSPMLWRSYYHEISANAVFWWGVLATAVGIMVGWGCWLGLHKLPQTHLPPWLVFILSLSLGWAGLQGTLAAITAASGLPLQLAMDIMWHMVLPLLTLTLEMAVFYALVIRSDLYRSRPSDKGFTPFFALFLALSFGALFNVETVHSWPGIGLTMMNAILSEDMSLAVGALVYIVIALIVINTVMAIYRGLRDLRRKSSASQREEPILHEPGRRARWPLWVAAALVLTFAGMAVAHPLLLDHVWDPAVYDPVRGYQPESEEQLARGLNNPLPPSSAHLLGTDPWGRDVLSQLLYSARVAFRLGGLAGLIAVILGLVAALLLRALEIRAKPVGTAITALGSSLLALPLLPSSSSHRRWRT